MSENKKSLSFKKVLAAIVALLITLGVATAVFFAVRDNRSISNLLLETESVSETQVLEETNSTVETESSVSEVESVVEEDPGVQIVFENGTSGVVTE